MKKELREQIEDFIESNKVIRQLCDENFKEKKEKDIVLFWLRCINYDIYFKQILGMFQYNSSNLSYGIEGTKLDIKQLTEEQFQEILDFYLKKGYKLNYLDDTVTEHPKVIVIKWDEYEKQTIDDKKYILRFKKNKLKKLYSINKKENNCLKAFWYSVKDFYWYLFLNHSYCLNAMKQNRKTRKSKSEIEKRKNKN